MVSMAPTNPSVMLIKRGSITGPSLSSAKRAERGDAARWFERPERQGGLAHRGAERCRESIQSPGGHFAGLIAVPSRRGGGGGAAAREASPPAATAITAISRALSDHRSWLLMPAAPSERGSKFSFAPSSSTSVAEQICPRRQDGLPTAFSGRAARDADVT